MTGVATLPDVDLEAMLAEGLPPCEVVTWKWWEPEPPPDGRPSVTVITITCPACGPRRSAVCAEHLEQARRSAEVELPRCGLCRAEARLTIGGLS